MEALTNLTLGQLFGTAAGIAALISVFIEIAPIKVNPLSKLLGWAGEKFNGNVIQKVSDLEKKVMEMRDDNERQIAVNCRYRILRFGDEVLHGAHHSKDHFEQILLDIDTYEHYCAGHDDFKNNITHTTTEIILEAYKRCRAENDFL